jgi:curli biogenesis system outer membrane secretion channel CsgG
MNNKLVSLKLFFLLLVFSSCTSLNIKNVDQYQKQFLPSSKFMPSKEQLSGAKPKIVVFDFDVNDNEVAINSNLAQATADKVEAIIGNNLLAQIVDRKAANKLQKEIQLIEANKTGSYKGPIIADYAISGSISNASFVSKYSSGFTYFNYKTGQLTSVPPKYNYSSEVSGILKIYELPSLAVIEAVDFSGSDIRSEAAQQEGGLSLGAIQIGGKKVEGAKRDDSLVRNAAKEAIENIEIKLKNFFAKKGYILEKRVKDKKVIFKISLGSEDGIKKGDIFEVFAKYEIQNQITNETEIEKRFISLGKVTSEINAKSAFVIIDDEEKIDSIRLGDQIKMKYQLSASDKIFKFAKNMAKFLK